MKIKTSYTSTFATFVLAISSALFTSCGTRTEGTTTDVDTTQYELTGEATIEKDEAITLPAVEQDFDGKHYVISVHRAPSDSLPQVKDSYGDPYMDNEVTISVTADGNVVTKRTFTKNDFSGAAKADLSKLVLGGMTFSSINGTGIHFNAQINSPGSVEGGNNFILTLPLNGGAVQIVADESADDMSSNDD